MRYLPHFSPPQWLNGIAFTSHAGDLGSIPARDGPKSIKQVVTAPIKTLGNKCESHGSSEMTIINGRPVSQ